MPKYSLSNEVKNDSIRIHQNVVKKFGMAQADIHFYSFFHYFDNIALRPYSFELAAYIKKGYQRCVCVSDSIYFILSDQQVDIMALVGQQDFNNNLYQGVTEMSGGNINTKNPTATNE
ncbi:MAG: toxin ParE1/3/4 [Chitinophagales bacterium]|jgi:toxin ParE1/3/4